MLFTATDFRTLSFALAGALTIASFTSAQLIKTVQRGNLPAGPTHFTVSHDAPRSWRRDGNDFANATLSRRAGGKVRNVHLSDGFHSDLAIDGKYFTLGFDLSDNGITFQAHDDNSLAWDPKTSKAKPGGVLGGSRWKGKEYQVDVEWDGNPFKGVSVVAGISDGSKAFTGEVGCIGLGLSNSKNNFVGRSFPSLAKVIPFFGLDYASATFQTVLSIGAAPHKIKQHFMVPSAMKDRWTIGGSLNGQHVDAMDFTPADGFSYGPIAAVKAIMIKNGLKPKALPGGGAPLIYANVDCKKHGPTLVLELGKDASLTYEGFSSTVEMEDGTCQFVLRGSDDDSYPTHWSLGSYLMSFPMIFDARSGSPQVGFGASRDG